MIRVGILSDTHLDNCKPAFVETVQNVFSECQVIIHAGDITDISLLDSFVGKDIYAVHGNMCNHKTCTTLPEKRLVSLGGYAIGICHGAGPRHNIEDRMFDLFPLADCIVYGHTHQPVCHRIGKTLIINPGSFQATGRYGAPGTYALLTIAADGLNATLHELPAQP
ncbi:metallophosphoesterase family protein [Desulfosediminicola ganghwensis]|uniref:metallophosphoesterase family protein n=1 Tax=Desulfosediminicola ganghwensis TaxID=2569540 RepID=UPI0010ACC38B|nr:metallophosphoesterase family protein [Desulfosediminicola ganghwensis]